jgi:hypothetical protein
MPDDLGDYDEEMEKRIRASGSDYLDLDGLFEEDKVPPPNPRDFAYNGEKKSEKKPERVWRVPRSDGPYRDNIASLYGKRSQLLDELQEIEERIREREAMIIPHITSGPSRLDGWLHKLGWKLVKKYRPYKYDCPDEGICLHREGMLCDIDCAVERDSAIRLGKFRTTSKGPQ